MKLGKQINKLNRDNIVREIIVVDNIYNHIWSIAFCSIRIPVDSKIDELIPLKI